MMSFIYINNKKRIFFIRFLIFIIFFIIWDIIAKFYNNEIIFPELIKVIIRMKEILLSSSMWEDIIKTIDRGFKGLIIGAVIGIFLGIIIAISKYLDKIISPLITFIQATPIISFLLIFLIWFDNKIIPYIVVIISIMPIFVINVREGVFNLDKKIIEMAKFYKVNNLKIIKEIYIPGVYGYIISALKASIGITFRIAVMAEVISHPGSGIGDKMNSARINVETVDIIAWTAIIIILTVLFEVLVKFIFEKILTVNVK